MQIDMGIQRLAASSRVDYWTLRRVCFESIYRCHLHSAVVFFADSACVGFVGS